jgi:hypothetical protein
MPKRSISDLTSAPWWPEFLELKDRMTWTELSRHFGIGRRMLLKALKRGGLTKAPQPPGRKPRKQKVVKPPVQAVIEASPKVVHKRGPHSKIDAFAPLIGKMPDAAVAKTAGVTRAAVWEYRKRHGIAGFAKPKATVVPVAPVVEYREVIGAAPVSAGKAQAVAKAPVSTLEAFHDRLGKVADHEIAALAGVSLRVVGYYRRKMGIPAYAGFRFEKKRVRRIGAKVDAAPAPAAEIGKTEPIPQVLVAADPLPAPVVGPVALPPRSGFGVVAFCGHRKQKFIVVGNGMVDAAERATVVLSHREDGPWKVGVIRVLAEVLE